MGACLSSGEELDIIKMAERLDREPSSVRNRVKKLKLTGISTRKIRRFTLQEDLAIIDSAIKNLHELLEDTQLMDPVDLALSLGRDLSSVKERWERRLKLWLKSYYTGTLNLDIKVMLGKGSFNDINCPVCSPELDRNGGVGGSRDFYKLKQIK